MVSMKCETDDSTQEYKPNPYGYGLEIRLNEDQCEALGITTPPTPGTKVIIKAATLVTEVRQTMEADVDDTGPDIYMCLQITDLELGGADSSTKASSMLYD
jgi:hypothetical protein